MVKTYFLAFRLMQEINLNQSDARLSFLNFNFCSLPVVLSMGIPEKSLAASLLHTLPSDSYRN